MWKYWALKTTKFFLVLKWTGSEGRNKLQHKLESFDYTENKCIWYRFSTVTCVSPFMPTIPFLGHIVFVLCDSNSTKHWILLTCSAGSSRKVTPIQRLDFPPFHNKADSHLQRFLTTFWTPRKAIEDKSIISLSFIFLYHYQTITKNKKWKYWCHLNMFCWHCSENEPTCVSVCLDCCPENGTVHMRGKGFLTRMWGSALCIRFNGSPAPVIRFMQFHYCTVGNRSRWCFSPFGLKRCM